MWIRSQNVISGNESTDLLVNATEVWRHKTSIYANGYNDADWILGKYETEDRAKEVFHEIRKAIASGIVMFQMPDS